METKASYQKYKETLAYMFASLPMYQRVGAAAYKADLNNTIELLNLLDNPQNKFKTIHVAGTNGKGSVSNFLAAILQASGYKAGLYTSPHLVDFRERIRINGKIISKQYVVDFIELHKQDFEKIQPSFFEMTVGLAFQYFADKQVDVAVIEVGMGGRLDSTNVIHPELSIITNIGIDHTKFLGDTLEKIAGEKAGIIKASVPVVIGETQKETEVVFLEKARAVGTNISFADQHYKLLNHKIGNYFLIADVFRDEQLFFPSLRSSLQGLYQLKNLATVFQAVEELNKKGFSISDSKLRNGIENVTQYTHFSGRWQAVSQKPLVICDIGHNEDGIKYVLSQLQQTPYEHLHIVWGMVNDKEIDVILGLLPRTATYYFCKPDIPRGLDTAILTEKALDKGLTGKEFRTVRKALRVALKTASEKDLILVGGSAFVVAEIMSFRWK